ncbi:hypothetical protein [Chryseobacterium binzhouense]|uniref:hypothetical protein n=1 Tax=Chryseobacterium binzhouense TaxID=2593646 RepID=UPI00117DD937|nr:hypothetical protein [Chryseobacterium binzhouense]
MDKLDTYKEAAKQNRDSTTSKKKKLLKVLEKTMGVIQPACKMAGINRQTFYNWIKSDSQFYEDYQDLLEKSLDFAETSLLKQIADGNTRAIIFFLSNRGKHRGYRLSNSKKANYRNNQKCYNEVENMSDTELMEIICKEYHIKTA